MKYIFRIYILVMCILTCWLPLWIWFYHNFIKRGLFTKETLDECYETWFQFIGMSIFHGSELTEKEFSKFLKVLIEK